MRPSTTATVTGRLVTVGRQQGVLLPACAHGQRHGPSPAANDALPARSRRPRCRCTATTLRASPAAERVTNSRTWSRSDCRTASPASSPAASVGADGRPHVDVAVLLAHPEERRRDRLGQRARPHRQLPAVAARLRELAAGRRSDVQRRSPGGPSRRRRPGPRRRGGAGERHLDLGGDPARRPGRTPASRPPRPPAPGTSRGRGCSGSRRTGASPAARPTSCRPAPRRGPRGRRRRRPTRVRGADG